MILKNETELNKLNKFLPHSQKETLTSTVWSSMWSFFGQKNVKLEPTDIVVNKDIFEREYYTALSKLKDVFEKDLILEHDIYK